MGGLERSPHIHRKHHINIPCLPPQPTNDTTLCNTHTPTWTCVRWPWDSEPTNPCSSRLRHHNDHSHPQRQTRFPPTPRPPTFQTTPITMQPLYTLRQHHLPHSTMIPTPPPKNCIHRLCTIYPNYQENHTLPIVHLRKERSQSHQTALQRLPLDRTHHEIYNTAPEHLHFLPSLLSPQTSYPLISLCRSQPSHRLPPCIFIPACKRKL